MWRHGRLWGDCLPGKGLLDELLWKDCRVGMAGGEWAGGEERGYHVFEVCSSLHRQLRKSWQSSMAFLGARWANSLLALTSVKLGLEVNGLVPTAASTEFGTVSESSSYFKLLLQDWFPPPHTSLPLPPLSFFFFQPHKSYFSVWKGLAEPGEAFTRGCGVFPRACGPQTGTDAGQDGKGIGCLWLPGAYTRLL